MENTINLYCGYALITLGMEADGEYREVDGFQYFYADQESLMETVIELFYQPEE